MNDTKVPPQKTVDEANVFTLPDPNGFTWTPEIDAQGNILNAADLEKKLKRYGMSDEKFAALIDEWAKNPHKQYRESDRHYGFFWNEDEIVIDIHAVGSWNTFLDRAETAFGFAIKYVVAPASKPVNWAYSVWMKVAKA